MYCLSLLILLSACGGNEDRGEYENLQHRGSKEVVIDKIRLDTIFIDANETSLMGKWGLNNGKLYFLDYNLVGIKEFDLDGNFGGSYIKRGNAANEWTTTFVDFCFDEKNNLITIDKNWIISSVKQLLPYS
ncbi:MAG: hypothetical protein R3Y50_09425 [Rikenellaceae bacterium]